MDLYNVVWCCKHNRHRAADIVVHGVTKKQADRYVADNTTKATLTNGKYTVRRTTY